MPDPFRRAAVTVERAPVPDRRLTPREETTARVREMVARLDAMSADEIEALLAEDSIDEEPAP